MTDTTAPAADDLREAVKQQIYDWIAVAIDGDDYEICGRIEAADAILALIAPRLAAARAEGRREAIAEAAEVADGLGASLKVDPPMYAGSGWLNGYASASEDIAAEIRALADAPRQDAGGMTEGA